MGYALLQRVEKPMGLKENFQRLIERKQADIRELEVKIREAQSYLQALQDSAKLLPKDNDTGNSSGGFSLRPGSSLAAVRDAIKQAGVPLHVNDLLAKLGKSIDSQNRVSLVGTLGSYSRKGRIFSRTAPNTFGLIELGHKEAPPEEDLPSTFGKMTS